MLILALETSSQAGSVALVECDGERDSVLSQRMLPEERRSAAALAPMTAEVLADAGRRAADVRLVAVTVGPGSFTGLRVGVTMAKTFAYAVGCECLGVDTLEVIASQVPLDLLDQCHTVHAVLDAQRKELFHAKFLASRSVAVLDGTDEDARACSVTHGLAELFRIANANEIVTATNWIQSVGDSEVVTGPGLRRLSVALPARVVSAPEGCWEPNAVTVALLAHRAYLRGRRDDLWKLVPRYLRASAAEEKAAKS